MEKTKLPVFEGKPLIEIPEFIPQVEFLRGNFGKAFLEEYNGRVRHDYNDNSKLEVLKYDDGVVKHSNPLAVVLANQILREEGSKIATQADLEEIFRKKVLDLSDIYQDTGLVLRNEEDKDWPRNTPLAKNLAEQLKEREIDFSPETPVMIPLTEFELENSDNYYGLIFKLRENAQVYEASVLSKEGKFDSKDIDKKIGLPKKVKESGNRTLYTRGSGLSRLAWTETWFWAPTMGLSTSFYDGRIVVVSGERPEKLKSDLIYELKKAEEMPL